MDEIVKKALAKWPNVPSCTGWLALDRRGTWRMRDEKIQASGAAGVPIVHTALLGFICRNYGADEHGQWYFQNGPQRVFIELAYTPWVVRLHNGRLTDQRGEAFEPRGAWLDEQGNVLFSDVSEPPRIALLHDHDLDAFADGVDEQTLNGEPGNFRTSSGIDVPVATIRSVDVPRRFHFEQSPAALEKAAAAGASNAAH
ncbi:MAG: DUF2946 family protein [Janthinobacterium lividum]